MEGYVYILESSDGRYYIGSTINIDRRIREHQSGHTTSLKYKLPIKLLFKQKFDNIRVARRIERLIKQRKGRIIIKKIIEEGVIKII